MVRARPGRRSGRGQEERVRGGQARLGMSGHVPVERQTRPGGAWQPSRPIREPDLKPSTSNQELWSPWTPITAEPAFLRHPLGAPWQDYKTPSPSLHRLHYPADSFYPADFLCFADPPSLLLTRPGVLPEATTQ